jgi:hypothetical protein
MATAGDTSAGSSGGIRAALLDIPSTLLNPLQSLPHPLSLDDVKKLVGATAAAPEARTK